MDLADIRFKLGSVNPCGISDEIYFIPKSFITAWPTIEDDFDAAQDGDEYAQYDGSFTLAAGKTWTRLYSTQGKGKISWEYQGASNGDFVFCVKHDGKFYIIGSPDYRATLTPNGDSGDSAGSAKGITIEIECPDTTPLPTYVGNIVLADGTLNCSTGVFTPTGN